MSETIIVWYFAVWGMSGQAFATIGPFESKADCIAIQVSMAVGTQNHFSDCWKSPIIQPRQLPTVPGTRS